MRRDIYHTSASVWPTFTQEADESCSAYYARVRAFQTDDLSASSFPLKFRHSGSDTSSSDQSTSSFVGQIKCCQSEEKADHPLSLAFCSADNNSDIRLTDKRVFSTPKSFVSRNLDVTCRLNTDLSRRSSQIEPYNTSGDEPCINALGEKSLWSRLTSALSRLFTSCAQTDRT